MAGKKVKKIKNKVDLRKLFESLQNQMSARLNTNKGNISHPVIKGDASELCWLDLFDDYLPCRYKAKRAIVVDSNGNRSDQIDIVIFDQQYSPFLLKQDGAVYIPAESVYAVLEVRQELNKSNIVYAGKKALSVRKLFRTTAPIYDIGGKKDPKPHFQILSGIVTLKSNWKSLNTAFDKSIQGLKFDNRLDLGCVLETGSFETIYSDKKLHKINKQTKENAFLFFFFKLLERLQLLGTVPAIELSKYAQFIK
ncbi:MAG TPA: DUF6602 domain-containing protein [Ignavibacteria bacterium]|jgi:hypothetical protein